MKIKQPHKLLRLLSSTPQRNLNGSSTHFQLKKQSLLLHLRFARLGIFKILKGGHHTTILGSGLVEWPRLSWHLDLEFWSGPRCQVLYTRIKILACATVDNLLQLSHRSPNPFTETLRQYSNVNTLSRNAKLRRG